MMLCSCTVVLGLHLEQLAGDLTLLGIHCARSITMYMHGAGNRLLRR